MLRSFAQRPELTASRLACELPITRQAVARHLAALQPAALVTGAASGIGRATAARLALQRRLRVGPLEDVILQPHAVKRLIEPGEVAGAIAFLAGPHGAASSGVPLTMDLGWTAR